MNELGFVRLTSKATFAFPDDTSGWILRRRPSTHRASYTWQESRHSDAFISSLNASTCHSAIVLSPEDMHRSIGVRQDADGQFLRTNRCNPVLTTRRGSSSAGFSLDCLPDKDSSPNVCVCLWFCPQLRTFQRTNRTGCPNNKRWTGCPNSNGEPGCSVLRCSLEPWCRGASPLSSQRSHRRPQPKGLQTDVQ